MAPPDARRQLDQVDHQLIAELIVDGRMTFSALAPRVGLSESAVRARVHRLLDDRLVTVTARVDPRTLGADVFGFALLDVDVPAGEVALELARIREAVFVVCLSGRWALLVELRCPDPQRLLEVLDAIRATAGVVDLEMVSVLEYFKQGLSGVVSDVLGRREEVGRTNPVPSSRELDEIDHELIKALMANGRASYAGLAERVGLSEAAVGARTQRLMDEGVVVIQAYANAEALGLAAFAAVLVSVRGPVDPVQRRVSAMPECVLAAAVTGRCDLFCEVWCRDAYHLLDTLDAVRAAPGVWRVESVLYLDNKKEQY